MFLESPTRDTRRDARALYWQGWRPVDIARHFNLPRTTVESWKARDGWDKASVIERVESTIEARMVQLVAKGQKSGSDYKEIDLLGRQIERMARVRRYGEPGGHEGDLNPAISERGRKARASQKRNAYTPEQKARLIKRFHDELFDYQRAWHSAGLEHRIRDILKSRQIGATWYFAREALVDAMETGRNQIFMSASRAQAHVFRQYVIQFAAAEDIELKGEVIVLPENGAHLYFLGTNAKTAQSYHGNLYFDEYFWVSRFAELRKVASGMAIHKKWRQTYFSTPSTLAHEAYPFWSGEAHSRARSKVESPRIDVSHAALKAGRACADGQWRQIVTVLDAMEGGCDLFDIDQLRVEYSPDEFANLLMCEFIDDTASVFTMAKLSACMVDSWLEWTDLKPFASRPFADSPVWIGYDPSHSGDGAGCVVVAPPDRPGGMFRVLERHQWFNLPFAEQAAQIQKLTKRFNVQYIGIDATGIGQGVMQLVRVFFPAAREINYSLDTKNRLVLKAKDVIEAGRLQFDAGFTDLAAALMAIRQTTTDSGRATTYVAGRREGTGHADLAWALMHALDNEPINAAHGGSRGILEIS